jgi:hypothetical protein
VSELESFSWFVGDIYYGSLDPALGPRVFSRWAPGAEATAVFTGRSKQGGGEILHIIKMALSNPDFMPFLHRARSDR